MKEELNQLKESLELNLKLLETLENVSSSMINFSKKNNIPLPNNLLFLTYETRRLIEDIRKKGFINTDAPSTPDAPKCFRG